MRKKPCQASTKKADQYVVRYYDCEWHECEQLCKRGTLADVMIEVALWCRSRDLDVNDKSIIVFSIYHHYPYISIEQEDAYHGEVAKEK